MIKIYSSLVIFGGGFVAAINLSSLLSTNPYYHASWAKVILSCCIAVVATFITLKEK